MQFTPQQLAGYKGYSAGVLIGNWNEDLAVQTDKLKLYRSAVAASATATTGQQSSDLINVAQLSQRVSLFPAQADGLVRFGVPLQIRSLAADAVLALDTTVRSRPRDNQALVTATTDKAVNARSAWVLSRLAGDSNLPFYKANKEGDVLHYGQSVRISNEYASGDGFYSLSASLQNHAKTSGFLEAAASLGTGSDSIFVTEPAGAIPGSLDGNPVKIGDAVVLVHRPSNGPLACPGARRSTAFGSEFELTIGIVKTAATKAQAKVASQKENFFTFVAGQAGASYTPFAVSANHENALARVRAKILERGGNEGFRGVARVLRVMDGDKNARLSRVEFKQGLDRYGVSLSTSELDYIFKIFDRDGDGVVTVTEFLREIRGAMNARRTDIVTQGFAKVDLDKSGVVTLQELTARYRLGTAASGASQADLEKAVRNFADSFGGCNGKITLAQFVDYYSDVSPAIDSDDYFELMVRNTWHISGGQGVTENTSNKRVLVIFNDGTQKVIGIEDDLGLDTNNIPQLRQRLEQQGVRDIKEIKTSA
jgi:Ca2+-binding EF-hand superfamily protein